MPSIDDSKCILVVGATAGIGRALALAVHALPSTPTVIVAGRRKERLDDLVKKGQEDGGGHIKAIQVDVSAGNEALKAFSDEAIRLYPEIDTVILSAGIQRAVDFKKPETIDLNALHEEFNINYLAVLSLITFFLPHFLKLSAEGKPTFIIPITSGLAVIPNAGVANYCATKSALHSLSMSMRNSLNGTNVHVMEILPPLVESELHDQQGTTQHLSKFWMPLDEFTKHAMDGLQRGDFNIFVPAMKDLWDKFEKERIEMSAKGFKLPDKKVD